VTGVDVSQPMLEQARALDPGGDYRLVGHGDLGSLQGGMFDLILSAFTFDNIATRGQKETALAALKRVPHSQIKSRYRGTHVAECLGRRESLRFAQDDLFPEILPRAIHVLTNAAIHHPVSWTSPAVAALSLA
jgi:ubiquinone/menaquinone biosynthesis C-methylase UbiE